MFTGYHASQFMKLYIQLNISFKMLNNILPKQALFAKYQLNKTLHYRRIKF